MQKDRDYVYATVLENWSTYVLPKASGVVSPVIFLYFSMFYMDETYVEQRFLAPIVEIEFLILALGAFLRTTQSGSVSRLSFSRLG